MPYQPTNQGYDVIATKRLNPDTANGRLVNLYKDQQLLWVYEVKIDFAISGNMGQSFRTRSMFPHNFTQPSFSVSCQAPQQEYGDTAEFIRDTQTALGSSTLLEIVPTMRALPDIAGERNRRLRGTHSPIAAEGYIKRMAREHTRHEYVKDFTFEFVVERLLAPANWSEDPVKIRRLLSWNDVIAHAKTTFVDDPNAPYVLPDWRTSQTGPQT